MVLAFNNGGLIGEIIWNKILENNLRVPIETGVPRFNNNM